jgi:hypothetical protein
MGAGGPVLLDINIALIWIGAACQVTLEKKTHLPGFLPSALIFPDFLLFPFLFWANELMMQFCKNQCILPCDKASS